MAITEKNVTFQSNDDLNEDNLRKLVRVLTDGSGNGFVHRGFRMTADHTNNNITVDDGHALIVDDTGDGAYTAEHPGVTDASIDSTTVNYLFLTIDPTVNNDVTIEINTSDMPARTPALKIGEVDAASSAEPVETNHGRSGKFESLIVEDSITDPAGVEHTGELADTADLSNYSPTTHDHAGDDLGADSPVNSVAANSATVGEFNGTVYAEPGEVQSAIDTAYAAGGGVVYLHPGHSYSSSGEGGEVHIKKNVYLFAPGVTYTIDTDVNGFFVDNQAKLWGYPDIQCTLGDSYTSVAVLFDQGRCEDGTYGYGPDSRNPASVAANIESTGRGGAGMKWICVDGGIAFTQSDVCVRNFSSCLEFDANDYHINANQINGTFSGATNIIRNIGGICRSKISGVIQCATGGPTDRVFWNEDMAGNLAFTYVGDVWDPYGTSVSSVEGNDMTIITNYQNAYAVIAHVDTSLDAPRSKVYGFGDSMRYGVCETGEMWEHNYYWGGWDVHHYDSSMTKTQKMRFLPDGELRVDGPVNGNYTF
ncbi:hypothetical protein [Haladaptatus salinisoli]|uniref:hypothetical protein n=1 Tax=Haladaptatus salinisoli TaxID=2884876 RepID=UPI001D0ADDC3|nr:hypothetical protein [Haladaptatus salinisoli]